MPVSTSSANSHWFALYTRPRQEKKAREQLSRKRIECFLPVAPRLSRWSDRTRRIEWPLFPSYIFVRVAPERLSEALRLPSVTTVVRMAGEPVPIDPVELDNVRRFAEALASSGLEAIPKPIPDVGKQVEVIEGPFRGVRGVVVERRGRGRLLVGISAVGQGLEVELPSEQLEPLR